ncbi:MAG: CvpA family protein [Proteobacteria bacterium]|nr:CvpA family protein [Pseudomonadota bacterium]MDA1351881.1 CvpA family protein [Pseudomonadota bacterium]
MGVGAVDTAIVVIIAVSGCISLIRGFVKEAMSLVIWLTAFVVAMTFKELVAEVLVNVISLASMRQLAAWLILFVGTLLIGAMVNFLLGKLVSSTGLSGTDRTLGLVFGVLRGALIVLALVVLLPEVLPVDQDLWWTSSKLIPVFMSFKDLGIEAAMAVKDFIIGWI